MPEHHGVVCSRTNVLRTVCLVKPIIVCLTTCSAFFTFQGFTSQHDSETLTLEHRRWAEGC